jgi:MFS family permease
MTRTVIPALAESDFDVPKNSFLLLATFVVAFGLVKGAMNFVAGRLSKCVGRKQALLAGLMGSRDGLLLFGCAVIGGALLLTLVWVRDTLPRDACRDSPGRPAGGGHGEPCAAGIGTTRNAGAVRIDQRSASIASGVTLATVLVRRASVLRRIPAGAWRWRSGSLLS